MATILRFLAFSLIGLFLMLPAAADEAARQVIDSARGTLSDIESALKGSDLTEAELARLRELNDPLAARLQAVLADLAPRLEASRKRLAELKPASKDAQDAGEAVSAELKDEQAKFAAMDLDLRSARALLVQSDDAASRIGAARREFFAKETFARSYSVFSPTLWQLLANETPRDAVNIADTVSNWARGLTLRLSKGQALEFLGFVLALIALAAPARWLAARVIARDRNVPSPTRLRRALAAAWTTFVLVALPLAALWALAHALDVFDISDPKLQTGFDAILDALRLVAVSYAFGKGLVAPGEPNWRMFPLSNRTAAILFRFLMFAAMVWGLEKIWEALAEETSSLIIAIASRATSALFIGLAAAVALRRIVEPQFAAQPGKDRWAPARTLTWVYVAVLLGATLTGYVAFAAFLINQTLFVLAAGGALYLADAIIQESAEVFLKPDTALGHGLMTIVGVRRDTIEQIVVIFQALARVAALIAALVLALGPLGRPSQDLVATARAAYFGFTVGGVTISPSSMVAAVGAFVVVILATRAVQNWLRDKYFPRAGVDPSVGDPIRTLTGYIGLVLALLLGGARLGLDIQQFGLVAGALSVGIGFGLQGIVNNFVSGLILLLERGIRVGDWVVVGAEQGFVRKINARATEIETFDRATVIVPNLNLVTGTVKNWMYFDRVARLVINVNIDFGADPEAVRELMVAAAKTQDAVLTIPAPAALFIEIGEWSLKFQLICFVDDALMTERVRSEINFELFRRLREARIQLALPYPAAK